MKRTCTVSQQAPSRRRHTGFTLVEITVVLAIAALVSAITLTGFKSIAKGNQRTSCQTNMIQIYQACRLYAADESGNFPYYDAAATTAGDKNIGLWTLYTFPEAVPANDTVAPQVTPTPVSGAAPGPLPPIGRYIRNVKVFHCPADNLDPTHESLYLQPPLDPTNSDTIFNPAYLSYQTTDAGVPVASGANATLEQSTYQSFRTTDNTNAEWPQQLLHYSGGSPTDPNDPANRGSLIVRTPAAETVVLWCPWHYANDINKPYDNVLFYDGSVRFLPRQQIINGTTYVGWHRLPVAQ